MPGEDELESLEESAGDELASLDATDDDALESLIEESDEAELASLEELASLDETDDSTTIELRDDAKLLELDPELSPWPPQADIIEIMPSMIKLFFIFILNDSPTSYLIIRFC